MTLRTIHSVEWLDEESSLAMAKDKSGPEVIPETYTEKQQRLDKNHCFGHSTSKVTITYDSAEEHIEALEQATRMMLQFKPRPENLYRPVVKVRTTSVIQTRKTL